MCGTDPDLEDRMTPVALWKDEVLALHRWGDLGPERARAQAEHLDLLYQEAAPLDEGDSQLLQQILNIEICNWRLEDSLLALCEGIGGHTPVAGPIGHGPSVNQERWRRVWAYYLSLRHWQSEAAGQHQHAYTPILRLCDPDDEVRQLVAGMLGDPDPVKCLRVERLCLHLEYWLDGLPDLEAPRMIGLDMASHALEAEIQNTLPQNDYGREERDFADHLRLTDNGQLHPCHYKLFRRYDILISSIGCGVWRGAMPPRGDSAAIRVELLEHYLTPMQVWLDTTPVPESTDSEVAGTIWNVLGTPDPAKRFLVALLISLMRCQQEKARA